MLSVFPLQVNILQIINVINSFIIASNCWADTFSKQLILESKQTEDKIWYAMTRVPLSMASVIFSLQK